MLIGHVLIKNESEIRDLFPNLDYTTNKSRKIRQIVGDLQGGHMHPPWTLFPMVFLDQYVEGLEKKKIPPKKSGP